MRYPDRLLGSTTSGSDVGQTTAVAGGKGAPARSVITKSRTDEGDEEEEGERQDVDMLESSEAVDAAIETLNRLGFADQVIERVRTMLKATSPSVVPATDGWAGATTDGTGVSKARWTKTDQPGGVATEAPVGGLPLTQQGREAGVVCVGGLRAPLEPTQVELRPRIQLEVDAPALVELLAAKKPPTVSLAPPAEHEQDVYRKFARLAMEAIGLPHRGLNPTAPRLDSCVRMPR